MKKTIYISGILSCLIIAEGIFFKIQHFVGAGILLTFGISFLALVFIPLALVNNYKNEENKPGKWFYIITYITCLVFYASTLFKIMHWSGAGKLLLLAVPFPFVVFLPVFLYHSRKEEFFSISQSVIVIFLLAYVSVMTAILALNVSKDILDDSILVHNDIQKSNNILIQQIENTSHKISQIKSDSLHEGLESISREGQEIFSLIYDIKWEIAALAEFESEGYTKDNINLFNLKAKDKNDPVEIAMFGDAQYARRLKKAFDEYRKYVLGMLPAEENALRDLVNKSFSTDAIMYKGEEIPWENFYFKHINAVWAQSNLIQFQSNVLLVESELLNYLYLAELTKQ